LKVGREEIAGLLVALDAFTKRDHEAEGSRWRAVSARVVDAVRSIAMVDVMVAVPETPLAYVVITLPSRARAALTVATLENGRPRVFVGATRISNGEIILYPQNVREQEVSTLIECLCGALQTSDVG